MNLKKSILHISKQLMRKRKDSENITKSPACRALTVFPDDIFITSYPKSGNTFCRFIISNLLYDDKESFSRTLKRVPEIYWHTNDQLKLFQRPRIIKSHEYFDPRYQKTIYIVRDVRSVIVSYYNYLVEGGHVSPECTYAEFTRSFLQGELDEFAPWQDNVRSWVCVRGNDFKRFCLIRYEDLHSRDINALRKICDFIGIERTDEQLSNAFERSSFASMQKLEKEYFQELAAKNETDVRIVRSGKVDEWRNILDDNTLKLIENECKDLMLELGYQW